MKVRTALVGIAAMAVVLVAIGCAPTPVTKYDVAYNYLDKDQYTEAIDTFSMFIEENPDSTLVPVALYNIAWAYRGLEDMESAKAAYTKVIEQYPTSEAAEWAKAEMVLLPAPAPAEPMAE